MNDLSEIKSCEVCGSSQLEPVLNLGAHPLCDDLVPIGDSKICPEYPIEILFCPLCVTAHQRFQVPKKELFPETYHYRSRFTADVLNGMKELVNACEKRVDTLAHKTVLDIGCNDGSLLGFFRAKGCVTVGIEPTGASFDAQKNEHQVYQAYLSEEVAKLIVKHHGQPDIITFTNVFAHIENLSEVVSAVKLLMSPSTMIVIENHYLGSVLALNQFDTFYHEHPRSYSYSSFVEIAKNMGTTIQNVEFPSRYGGNIRVFMGSSTVPDQLDNTKKILQEEKKYLDKFASLRLNISKWQVKKGKLIEQIIKKNKNMPGKAFPGRAAILIKMLGIDNNIMPHVSEKPGSMKIGHYIPGTRIPIISDDDLFNSKDKPPFILNLAWHISKEIKAYLTSHGFKGNIIDILNVEDFHG
jgi:hypothetical protein